MCSHRDRIMGLKEYLSPDVAMLSDLRKILVTGGAGFIGSNFIRHILSVADVQVTNLDKLTEAGNLQNLSEVERSATLASRYRFVRGDIADAPLVGDLLAEGFDAIINFAAESHVDRSIESPEPFLRSNYFGTFTLLEAARKHGIKRFLQIGTDEVYGSAPEGHCFTEQSPLNPSSPYAASKAAADLLVLSYRTTYGLPVTIVRSTNNYGPHQFPEKLIPLMIANAVEGTPLPVYGDGLNVRDWIYVEDFCSAIVAVLSRGRLGEIYNVGQVALSTNLAVVEQLLSLLNKSRDLIEFVADRPGHDRRYAIDSRKLRQELGWEPRVSLREGLRRTVDWYVANWAWVEACRTGSYREYYDRHYCKREATLGKIRQASVTV